MPARVKIERIVRKVLHRLENKIANDNTPNNINSGSVLTLTDRLITLSTIERRIEGINKVVILPGTVVTPAVKDELRRRKINLCHTETASKSISTTVLLLGTITESTEFDLPTNWLNNKTIKTEPVHSNSLPTLIQQMTSRMTQHNRIGLLLTDQPAAALCLANRQSHVRASLGLCVDFVGDAIQSVGTNLLIVDPRRKNLFEIRNMATVFATGGSHQCPANWKPHLEK